MASSFFRRLGYLRYITQPALWPEMARRLHYKLFHASDAQAVFERQRQEAIAWCKERACSTVEAIQKVTHRDDSLIAVREQCQESFAEAERMVSTCPVKMGGAGNLDLLYSLCEFTQAQSVLETGVAYGWSSLSILLSLCKRSQARLYSIDLPYLELHNDRWVGVAVPESLRSQWVLYRMADREGVPRAIQAARTFDVVHYDSDKSYEGRLATYHAVWGALRKEGILISDDVGDNPAFRDFCQALGMEPILIEYQRKFQGILVKP